MTGGIPKVTRPNIKSTSVPKRSTTPERNEFNKDRSTGLQRMAGARQQIDQQMKHISYKRTPSTGNINAARPWGNGGA